MTPGHVTCLVRRSFMASVVAPASRAASGGARRAHAPFGDPTPFCEPAWYQGAASPYYTEAHVEFRQRVRAFVDTELAPHLEGWVASKDGYPRSLHERAYAAGLQGVSYPREYGGTMPEPYDAFYECARGFVARASSRG